MNKLIIGLLILAAGSAAYFFIYKKNTTGNADNINKEWIVGKWKTDAVIAGDSNFNKYHFEFNKDGFILRSIPDSAEIDTTSYEWSKTNELIWKDKISDSTGKIFRLTKLTRDSLQVQTKDSTSILFTRLK